MQSRILVLASILAILLLLTVGTLSAAASGPCYGHYVAYGETVFSIARAYGVDPWYLASYNGLADANYIQEGQYLCIPYSGYDYGYHKPYYPGYYPGYHPGRWHYVTYGETLYSIGRLYNVDPLAIAKANSLYDPDYIQGGQVLWIPYGPPYYDYAYYDGYYGGYDAGYYDP